MLKTYAREVGDPHGDAFSIMSDVLTDLRHYADAEAVDFYRVIALSQDNYEAEKRGDSND